MNREGQEKLVVEMEKMLYIDLPNLIHKILHFRLNPTMYDKDFLEADIEQIKNITNAECDAAISYKKRLN